MLVYSLLTQQIAVLHQTKYQVTANSAAVEFPAASGGNWGTITHMAVMTASSGGTMIVHSALTTAKAINAGDVFRIPTGDLDITLA